ncbi:DUF397 domain-containing protein [Actinomadura sp. 21ATH]|uniref:DUF397 domain-containing protein n=1 Tax=Actinomadura sp. 21ATH TaxID=1735444 RepID=UPI0035C08BE6
MKDPFWRKSSRSNTQGNECVEVAHLGVGGVGLRDSKAPDAGHLVVAPAEFSRLVSRIKTGA